jgi:hypothetical protein
MPIGANKSVSITIKTTQLLSVSTGGFACKIKLQIPKEKQLNIQLNNNHSYIKIKLIIPKIINGL